VKALVSGLGCVVAGAAVGFLLGKDPMVAPPPGDARSAAADGAVLAELRDLSARVARLQATVAELRLAPNRQPAPLPADTPPSDDVEALVERLSQLVERLAGPTSNQVYEALRVARHQRPQPDVAAAEALATQLRDGQMMGHAEHLAVQREWLLSGMDEVVQRLGMPSDIGGEAPSEVRWSYQRPDGDEVVTFHFRDGLVVSVKED
jgi:hypothetical protein